MQQYITTSYKENDIYIIKYKNCIKIIENNKIIVKNLEFNNIILLKSN